jgi:hypothetical protein
MVEVQVKRHVVEGIFRLTQSSRRKTSSISQRARNCRKLRYYRTMSEKTPQPAASMSLAPRPSEVKVETWDALASELFVNSHNTKLDRHGSPYAFRGQGGDFPPTPGIMRLEHYPESGKPDRAATLREFQEICTPDGAP